MSAPLCRNCNDKGLAYGFRGAHEQEEYVCSCAAGQRIEKDRRQRRRKAECRILATECERLGVSEAARILREEASK